MIVVAEKITRENRLNEVITKCPATRDVFIKYAEICREVTFQRDFLLNYMNYLDWA